MPERHQLLPECTRFTGSDPFACYFYHMPSDASNIKRNRFSPSSSMCLYLLTLVRTKNCWKMISSAKLNVSICLWFMIVAAFARFPLLWLPIALRQGSSSEFIKRARLNELKLATELIHKLFNKIPQTTSNLESFTCEEEIMLDEVYALWLGRWKIAEFIAKLKITSGLMLEVVPSRHSWAEFMFDWSCAAVF